MRRLFSGRSVPFCSSQSLTPAPLRSSGRSSTWTAAAPCSWRAGWPVRSAATSCCLPSCCSRTSWARWRPKRAPPCCPAWSSPRTRRWSRTSPARWRRWAEPRTRLPIRSPDVAHAHSFLLAGRRSGSVGGPEDRRAAAGLWVTSDSRRVRGPAEVRPDWGGVLLGQRHGKDSDPGRTLGSNCFW